MVMGALRNKRLGCSARRPAALEAAEVNRYLTVLSNPKMTGEWAGDSVAVEP